MKTRALCPKGGNDRVYTPDALAFQIVAHFSPVGRCLEPCKGRGAFLDVLECNMRRTVEWCEIDQGVDFLDSYCLAGRFDWIVTNPPWGQFRAFLKRSMEVADNVVFLCLVNAFFMRARVQDIDKAGFAIKEILFVNTPPKPWPQTGFQLGAVHIARGYQGPAKISRP